MFCEGDDQGEDMMTRKSVFAKLSDQGDFYGENETLIYLEKERSKLVSFVYKTCDLYRKGEK